MLPKEKTGAAAAGAAAAGAGVALLAALPAVNENDGAAASAAGLAAAEKPKADGAAASLGASTGTGVVLCGGVPAPNADVTAAVGASVAALGASAAGAAAGAPKPNAGEAAADPKALEPKALVPAGLSPVLAPNEKPDLGLSLEAGAAAGAAPKEKRLGEAAGDAGVGVTIAALAGSSAGFFTPNSIAALSDDDVEVGAGAPNEKPPEAGAPKDGAAALASPEAGAPKIGALASPEAGAPKTGAAALASPEAGAPKEKVDVVGADGKVGPEKAALGAAGAPGFFSSQQTHLRSSSLLGTMHVGHVHLPLRSAPLSGAAAAAGADDFCSAGAPNEGAAAVPAAGAPKEKADVVGADGKVGPEKAALGAAGAPGFFSSQQTHLRSSSLLGTMHVGHVHLPLRSAPLSGAALVASAGAAPVPDVGAPKEKADVVGADGNVGPEKAALGAAGAPGFFSSQQTHFRSTSLLGTMHVGHVHLPLRSAALSGVLDVFSSALAAGASRAAAPKSNFGSCDSGVSSALFASAVEGVDIGLSSNLNFSTSVSTTGRDCVDKGVPNGDAVAAATGAGLVALGCTGVVGSATGAATGFFTSAAGILISTTGFLASTTGFFLVATAGAGSSSSSSSSERAENCERPSLDGALGAADLAAAPAFVCFLGDSGTETATGAGVGLAAAGGWLAVFEGLAAVVLGGEGESMATSSLPAVSEEEALIVDERDVRCVGVRQHDRRKIHVRFVQ